MAEEHGMYKGLAPGEREGERERSGEQWQSRSQTWDVLHCFVSALTANYTTLEKVNSNRRERASPEGSRKGRLVREGTGREEGGGFFINT